DVPLMSGEVAEQHSLACVRLTHPQPLLKKEQSVIGEGCVLGEKITIKNSAIGSDCKIAAKSKINSCVIMGHVEIGEGCTIQNSVISEGTVIGSNCNINECFTGRRVCIRDGSKIKGETISAADADNS
ncbi:EIF2B3, partial [Symbiodinium microadriaticum]